MDLFRCESATLRTHCVLVIMDQNTRRIIGFGVHAGSVNGVALCRMFNRAIRGQGCMPKYLSSDNDPLYKFHQWQANLRILEVTEIRSVSCIPLSSVRGEAHRHHSTRVFGSHVVLDDCRS
jgi:putative transposase